MNKVIEDFNSLSEPEQLTFAKDLLKQLNDQHILCAENLDWQQDVEAVAELDGSLTIRADLRGIKIEIPDCVSIDTYDPSWDRLIEDTEYETGRDLGQDAPKIALSYILNLLKNKVVYNGYDIELQKSFTDFIFDIKLVDYDVTDVKNKVYKADEWELNVQSGPYEEIHGTATVELTCPIAFYVTSNI